MMALMETMVIVPDEDGRFTEGLVLDFRYPCIDDDDPDAFVCVNDSLFVRMEDRCGKIAAIYK